MVTSLIGMLGVGCARDSDYLVTVSIKDQALEVHKEGERVARFPVSTSKYGLGDRRGSFCTPLGELEVAAKIGAGQPVGMKFKNRRPTGVVFDLEHYDPDRDHERDSILSRILWLKGLNGKNRNAYSRFIYIHGTNQEHLVGKAVSYGCIRMRNADVIALFELLPVGARVVITDQSLRAFHRGDNPMVSGSEG